MILGEQTGKRLGTVRPRHNSRRMIASDDAKAMQMQMGMGAGQQMGFDAPKAYKQERESLKLHNHEWKLDTIEHKILGDVIAPRKVPVHEVPSNVAAEPTGASKKRSKTTKFRRR